MGQSSSPAALAWRRFRRNVPAMVGLGWLLLCTLVAIFAYPLMPDGTHNGNFQVSALSKQPPGTAYLLMLKPNQVQQAPPGWFGFLGSGNPDNFTPTAISAAESLQVHADTILYVDLHGKQQTTLLPAWVIALEKEGEWPTKWKQMNGKPYLLNNQPGTPATVTIRGVGSDGNTSVQLASLQSKFENQLVAKGHFWLGSDAAGRDVLSRLILGTRVSLGIGLMAVLVSLLLGVTLGALAGFFRGKVDAVIMWFVSVVWSIPTLLLAISLAFVMGKGTWQLFLAIGISSWVDVARLVRGQIFSIREMQFVEATKALGYRWPRTIFRHILPNVLSPLIIIAAANFASAILMEAGLSFLGVGVQPPTPSWGSMIKEGYAQIMFDSGIWLAIFPGLAIILVVISLNLVGFGLRDALDPKQKG
ncbi:MAG: ABC transporter permease [Bacteroidetes bacterium]|nr:ABC transporter permease [Bacteroidota bacterium]MBP6640528.1 ABC transporter permease [Bacteroidia bacterium]